MGRAAIQHPGQYNRLLYRYRHVLIAQIFGHIHQDAVFVSKHKGIPSVPALIAPALSPVLNPAYRVLHLESDTLTSYQQFYAPGDFSSFRLEYDTSQVFPAAEAINVNFILKIQNNTTLGSSALKLMLNRFRNVCY